MESDLPPESGRGGSNPVGVSNSGEPASDEAVKRGPPVFRGGSVSAKRDMDQDRSASAMWSSLPPWGQREETRRGVALRSGLPHSHHEGLEMPAWGKTLSLGGRGFARASEPSSLEARRNSWGFLTRLSSVSSNLGRQPSQADSTAFSVDAPAVPELNTAAVPLVAATSEWGGAEGLSSSSSSDDDLPGRRRYPRMSGFGEAASSSRAPGKPAGDGVHVVQVEREWGGGLDLDSDSDEDISVTVSRRGDERRRQIAKRNEALAKEQQATFSFQDGAAVPLDADIGADADLEPGQRPKRKKRQRESAVAARADDLTVPSGQNNQRGSVWRCLSCSEDKMKRFKLYGGFVTFTLLHLADFCLRLYTIKLYFDMDIMGPLYCLVPIQAFGALLSIYITFHDADVLLIMHNLSGACRLLFGFLAFLFFGCGQVIQVKRAWSRQLHTAEVVIDLEDGRGDAGPRRRDSNYDDRATNASSVQDLAAAERITPVALITGVPFLLVHWFAAARCSKDAVASGLLLNFWWQCTTIVLIFTVGLGIVDVDYAVSSYVLKKYQMNPQGYVQYPRLRQLFAPLHVAFRLSEVVLRLLVLGGLMNLVGTGKGIMLLPLPLCIDYWIGASLLVFNSPAKEGLVVHLFAGVGLLSADMGHFVDQPNFAAPARHISRRLAVVRFSQLLVFVVLDWLVRLFPEVFASSSNEGLGWGRCRCLGGGSELYMAAAVYYMLRYSPPIRNIGSDLHTASLEGDARLLRKLLLPDHNGQVLDVNAAAKDSYGMTPLMLAAGQGHLEVIEHLLNSGAKVGLRALSTGETALHFAAQKAQVEACHLLIHKKADILVRDTAGRTPADVMGQRRGASEVDSLMELLSGRPADANLSTLSAATVSTQTRSTRRTTYYSVKTAPVAGLQLRTLFPNVENDEAPSPRVLQSVSALVVAKAAGSLARRVLAREDESGGSVPLGALRRVRELGRGGFGRVIEVELPQDAASTFWRMRSEPQRFALKLQLKADHRQASSEVLALRRAEHPFIVHLHRAFSVDKFLALLLELCPTDLNRLLCEGSDQGTRCLGLPTKRAARYMGQVMLALAYLHESDMVYRDVKPENILISTMDEAKLTDFGLAKVVTSAERMTMCGTMGFLSPELSGAGGSIVVSGAGKLMMTSSRISDDGDEGSHQTVEFNPFKTDAYSFGVTLQVTLLGEDGSHKKTVKRKGPMMLPLHLSESENAEMLAQLRESGRLSQEAEHLLVEKLLPFSQARRSCLTDKEVKNHPFFLKELECHDVEEYLLSEA
eukprot:TRINITY_DN17463_c0_g1_i2.p1 TRINITY_DN17463_c0_g1~~TRINITY_DN17463_c0_g1_i2.p1  ORF type:complete len:1278 (-),score=228.22 TRINITY_DN17463_c0_g1_i2:154-3987(-)